MESRRDKEIGHAYDEAEALAAGLGPIAMVVCRVVDGTVSLVTEVQGGWEKLTWLVGVKFTLSGSCSQPHST